MRRKQNKLGLSNIKIAIIFFTFVFSIVLVSLALKLIAVVNKSRFDNNRRFTVVHSGNKNREVISFSPKSRTIAILRIDKDSVTNDIGRFLAIPIDGKISSSLDTQTTRVSDFWFQVFLNFKNVKIDFTVIDIARLFLFSKTVPQNFVSVKNLPPQITTAEVDKIVGSLFNDESIVKDGKTLEIINATGIAGLGNRVARLITNIGGNVVIVKTADSLETESSISYFSKKTYTVQRLSEILRIKAIKKENKTIADITIVIGQDSLQNSVF